MKIFAPAFFSSSVTLDSKLSEPDYFFPFAQKHPGNRRNADSADTYEVGSLYLLKINVFSGHKAYYSIKSIFDKARIICNITGG